MTTERNLPPDVVAAINGAKQEPAAATDGYPIIFNGDHAEFEQEWAGKDPKERPDWPLPSFRADDWAEAFCKIANKLGYKNEKGEPIDEDWMIGWFANALMRGYDEHAAKMIEATNRAIGLTNR